MRPLPTAPRFLARQHTSRPGRTPFPLHTFCLALFPILTLSASNLGFLDLSQAVRPALWALALSALLLALLSVIVHEQAKAALILSVGLVWFFSYGHLYVISLVLAYALGKKTLPQLSGNTFALAWHAIAFPAWTLLAAVAIQRLRRFAAAPTATPLVNVLAAALLVWPSIQIVRSLSPRPQNPPPAAGPAPARHLPDIYYIILDGFGREDVLEEEYGLSDLTFFNDLRSMGFTLLDSSRSNYAQTILSLTSSLNMNYLDQLTSTQDVNQLIPLLQHSQVRTMLEAHGYRTVAFASGYGRTEIPDAAVYLRPRGLQAGTMESLLSETSVLLAVQQLASVLHLAYPYPGYAEHRARILFTLNELPHLATLPGPKFVFVHLLAPHPPFVFDESGAMPHARHAYALRDGSDFQGTAQEYVEGYRAQATYLSGEVTAAVSGLLEASPEPPVIILQGDHGPGAHLVWKDPSPEAVADRMAILNAIYLPQGMPVRLEPFRSPLNTFRWLLSLILEIDLPLLPDRSYYSATTSPFALTPVP
jgi:hypothetical protein